MTLHNHEHSYKSSSDNNFLSFQNNFPALNLHSRNFITAMQDPDGAAAFSHHHKIMTNVSFNSPKLEEKYRPSTKQQK